MSTDKSRQPGCGISRFRTLDNNKRYRLSYFKTERQILKFKERADRFFLKSAEFINCVVQFRTQIPYDISVVNTGKKRIGRF